VAAAPVHKGVASEHPDVVFGQIVEDCLAIGAPAEALAAMLKTKTRLKAEMGVQMAHLEAYAPDGLAQQDREALEAAARSGANLVEASLVLAKAGGTTGEWTETLARAFGGRYQATIGSDVAAYRPLNLPTAARPYRVFLAKSGLDGHVNAVKLLAYACRQSGMEVIYSGLQQTPQAIVSGAVQEGAEVIGISCLSGAHLHVAREVMAALAARGITDLPVVMGGIIPDHDAAIDADRCVRRHDVEADAAAGQRRHQGGRAQRRRHAGLQALVLGVHGHRERGRGQHGVLAQVRLARVRRDAAQVKLHARDALVAALRCKNMR
jgi:methylmalonyl-CoA mutase cobalamin-binding domain/chain